MALTLGDLSENEYFMFKDEIGKVKKPVLHIYSIEVLSEPVGRLGCRFYYTKRIGTPDRRVRSGD